MSSPGRAQGGSDTWLSKEEEPFQSYRHRDPIPHGAQSLQQGVSEGQFGGQIGDVPSCPLFPLWRALIATGIRGRTHSALDWPGVLPAAASEAEVAKPDPHRVSAQVWHPERCESPGTPSQLPARANLTSLCRRETLADHGVQPELSCTLPAAFPAVCRVWG